MRIEHRPQSSSWCHMISLVGTSRSHLSVTVISFLQARFKKIYFNILAQGPYCMKYYKLQNYSIKKTHQKTINVIMKQYCTNTQHYQISLIKRLNYCFLRLFFKQTIHLHGCQFVYPVCRQYTDLGKSPSCFHPALTMFL